MINIICVGKSKEKYFEQACDEYFKRLQKFTRIEITELAEYKVMKDSPTAIANALEKEGERIKEKLKGVVVALDSGGELLTSEEFAAFVQANQSPAITFVIGSANGLSTQFKKSADRNISFGKITYPHRIMKILLLEQIYRAYTIINNIPYHKNF